MYVRLYSQICLISKNYSQTKSNMLLVACHIKQTIEYQLFKPQPYSFTMENSRKYSVLPVIYVLDLVAHSPNGTTHIGFGFEYN